MTTTYPVNLLQLRLIYETTPTGFPTMEHKHAMWMFPVDAPETGMDVDEINVPTRGSGITTVNLVLDAYLPLIQGIYPVTTTFGRWEVWYRAANETAFVFINAVDIGAEGENVSPSQPAWEAVFTMRGLGGKYGKAQFMESSLSETTKETPPYGDVADDLNGFYTGTSNPFVCPRDGLLFFSSLHLSKGENEDLSRIRYGK